MMLPWVRLHGVSAYSDMAALLADHPSIRVTVSVSPSLLDQIESYLEGSTDDYEQVTLIEATELSQLEREFLVGHFFSVHWGQVLSQIPRYLELIEKRGRQRPSGGWGEAASRFSVDDLRDLQVLFNLAWFGNAGAADPTIRELLDKGRGYTEQDKQVVLDRQHQLLRTLPKAWRNLVNAGCVEVACTPYYHGLLPLLIDSNIAKRANPEVCLSERFSYPQDAETQLRRALDRFEEVLGARPAGLWPPEAAISPEVVKLARSCDLTYLLAHEGVLFHSLDDSGSTPGKRRLYQPYKTDGCAIFFCDTYLCQLIAEEYASWEDQTAAAIDFVNQVFEVSQHARMDNDAPPIVVIALRGENPWEAYPNRGHDFLTALYENLAKTDKVTTVTLGHYLERYPPATGLDFLHSGSRIETNFDVWIGDAEKNRAWRLLARARNRLDRCRTDMAATQQNIQQAYEHILRAEGSDWLWWMGEPFSSAEDPIYEALFRGHLSAAYLTLGDSPPADLARPIERGGIVEPLRQPSAFIHPRCDGVRTSFFEWRNAGFYRVPSGGSMYQEHSFINGLYWGFDPGRLYIRLDPVESHRESESYALDDLDIWLELTAPDRSFVAKLDLADAPRVLLAMKSNGGTSEDLGSIEEVAFKEVIEMAIPTSRLDLTPGTRLGLTVHFGRGGAQLSMVPQQGVIELEIPTADFGAEPGA